MLIRLEARKTAFFAPRRGVFFSSDSGMYIATCNTAGSSIALEGGGFMPRLSKKYKQEWAFFLDYRNRMKYNELCKKCEKECKQSFRAIIVDCPFERRSRNNKRKEVRTNGV